MFDYLNARAQAAARPLVFAERWQVQDWLDCMQTPGQEEWCQVAMALLSALKLAAEVPM